MVRGVILVVNRSVVKVVDHALHIDKEFASSDSDSSNSLALNEVTAVPLADAEHLGTLSDTFHDRNIDIC